MRSENNVAATNVNSKHQQQEIVNDNGNLIGFEWDLFETGYENSVRQFPLEQYAIKILFECVMKQFMDLMFVHFDIDLIESYHEFPR